MSPDPLSQADEALAKGDFAQAVELLNQAAPELPGVSELIQHTLDRMKVLAAKELVAGRWTEAEQLFGKVKEYEHRLTAKQRAEIEVLLREVTRLREVERGDALIKTATKLAAQGLLVEARHVALAAMESCEDAHIVARMRNLLQGLPHPDGRLLVGFDSPHEVRAFVKCEGSVTAKLHVDPLSTRAGSSAEVVYSGAGGKLHLVDVPRDWSGFGELNFWACLLKPQTAGFLLIAGEGEDVHHLLCQMTARRWTQLRAPLEMFEKQGSADWARVGRLTLASMGSAHLLLDEIRLKGK